MIFEISPANIDFEVPIPIIYHYYISGISAVLLNTFLVYLIIFRSGKIDKFKFYLLAFQIVCILTDINVTFLMQPIGLFPICAGYSYGIMSRTFNWSSHALMTMLTLCLAGQIEVLNICFFRKHRAIMFLGNERILPAAVFHSLLVLLAVSPFSIAALLYFSNVGREEQLRVLHELYPEIATSFEKLREFQYYVINGWMHVFFVMVVFGTAKSTLITGITVLQMFRVLQNTQKKISTKTVEKHKAALKALVAQFLTTPVAILPAGIVVLTVLIPNEYSQKISWYSIAAMTTHSILNSFVVIFTYPEFRKTVLFWRKRAAVNRKTTIATVLR